MKTESREVQRKQRRSGKRRARSARRRIIVFLSVVLAALLLGGTYLAYGIFLKTENPEKILAKYVSHIEKKEYEEMYRMVQTEDSDGKALIDKEEFIERNQKIYEAIEIQNIKLNRLETKKEGRGKQSVSYEMSFDTVAGEINFNNSAEFVKTKEGLKLVWKDSLIFPELESTDKVRVSRQKATRGEILDRNEKLLAGEGTASSVGIVPGKLEDKESAVSKVAELLDMEESAVLKKLEASWVKEDSFVPLATLAKINETELMKDNPNEETLKEKEKQEKLLAVPGVMISDTKVRVYPLGKAASHLVGYVQKVTAEDIREHKDENYSADAVIGKSGVEGLYEKELRGQDGMDISIIGEDGEVEKVLASKIKEDGADIRLTIDSALQKEIYGQFEKDKSCTVAMNPYSGEVLALVSTPSYDDNAFILGMSQKQWDALNEDEKKPLYNRFRQVWCPGSTFKPITAAIGLETKTINPKENFGSEGLKWQKDSSWGDYYVTTLHEYTPVTMKNALIYSDNIYFAKAALKIGAENLGASLDKIGFGKELPFEIKTSESSYTSDGTFKTEIQLADSGYGQGKILVNPIHLASIYTAFCNEGNMIRPYLLYEENPKNEVWITKAFSKETAETVKEGLEEVISNPHGTGHAAQRRDMALAGKTGTAEIKASKEDTSGTELGWFAVFTGKDEKQPLLMVSMTEDVKERGGSGYVVQKVKEVLDKQE